MRRTMICAASLAFLTGCAETAPDPWALVDPAPVRDWCPTGTLPELTAALWGSCSLVTREDAERLVAHRRLVEEQRR